ncbi:MAG TPA: MFS transporter [Candidatus Marinimicrobia bacterium]|jgi:sugar porter (SP) family MFS transporter|nr:MFS transporter [Candidatus Neomarinimicrobiota bacterium]
MSNKIDTKKNQLLIFSTAAALGGLLFGFDTGVISGAIHFIKIEFNLNAYQEGFAVSNLMVACVIGALLAGPIADWTGRKKVLILCAVLFTVSAILSALPRSFTELVIARFIGGMGVGMASVVSPMYIAEISPAKIRGRLVALNQLAIVVGILLSYLSNWLLVDTGINNWRYMLVAEILPAITFLVGLFFIPESPRWLTKEGLEKEALDVLNIVAGAANADHELQEVKKSLSEKSTSLKELLHPSLRRVLIVGILFSLFAHITGIDTIIYYGPIIFLESGFKTDSALLASVMIGITNLIFTFVGMAMVDKAGRKFLLLVGLAGMGISMTLVGLCMQSDMISAKWTLLWIMTYIASFAMSIGVVIWVYLSEIYPTRVRGQALSVATMVLWLGNVILTQLFPVMMERFGGGTFYIFSFICLLAFIFTWTMVKETKGVSLEEIEEMWV